MEWIRIRKNVFAFVSLLLFSLMVFSSILPASRTIHAQEQEYSLTILHTNDVHAHLLPFTQAGGECSEEDNQAGKCFGGVARQYSLIQQIRKEVPNVLLLDAGDQFQGTLFYNEYKGRAAQRFMNEFHYQAMTLGNHEFDDGATVLADFIKGLNFPVVSANIDASAEPLLKDLIKPFVILDVGGEKIAVIGAITPETEMMSSPGKNVIFKDVKDSVSTAVTEVKAQGVNKIILLSHIGYGADQELAASVDGIDVIVGGHSHTFLSSAAPEENIDQAAGPYPTVVAASNGDPVLIVQSYWMGKYLGVLNLTFDDKGKLIAWDGKPVLLDSKIQEDVQIKAEVEKLSQPLDALRKQVIGSSSVELNGERSACRFAECNMGNLITDAMLAKTQHLNTQIAILNGGSIRSSIAKGDVTMGMVLTVVPFGNALSVFGLKGADVWAAIEHGVSRAENPNNDGTGRFPQVSGLRYWWDKEKPAGSRVTAIEVKDSAGNYHPLEKEHVYQIVSIEYTRRGGDGYTVFEQKAINPIDDSGYLADAVVEYVVAHSPLEIGIEGRINQGVPMQPFWLVEHSREAMVVLPLAALLLALILLWSGVININDKEHE